MRIEFDPVKNQQNIQMRGLSFERVAEFEFDSAMIEADVRFAYGEIRMIAIGMLDCVPHVLIFTMRGDTLRVISFRKANKREVKRYEQATQP